MPIVTLDQLVAAMATGQHKNIHKLSRATIAVGDYASFWQTDGTPGIGVTPPTGTGAVPTSSTVGAIPFTNPSGTDKSYIAHWSGFSSGFVNIALYDRLWHNSGLDATVTSDTTFGPSTALTRPNANGENTELLAEIYTQIGITASTLTATYTNSAGVTGRTATFIKANQRVPSFMFPMRLQTGDTGVRSVESYSWSTTTGTAGDFGFTICRRITPNMNLAGSNMMDFAALNLPILNDNSCIFLRVFSANTTANNTGQILSSFVIVQG